MLKTFIIYARKDETHKKHLLRHLKPLVDAKYLEVWHDADMKPGEEWELAIKQNLKHSDIILVLVSSYSLSSDFIQTEELAGAFKQMEAGSSRIIQILVSPCVWRFSPILSKIQGLPKDMKAITKWENEEEAWTDVIEGIADVIEDIRQKREQAEMQLQAEIQRKRAEVEAEIVAKIEAEKRKKEAAEQERKAKEEAARKAAEAKHLQEEAERKANEDPFHDLMVKIPAGSFEMGSNDYDDEQPIHKVTLKAFEICKYQVTQKQWQMIMGENPSHFKGDENLPVEQVSWNDIQVFLYKLNAKTGKNYRLPSEAEWEYAARGGALTRSLTSNYKYAGSDNIDEVAWYKGNSGDKTHPLGQKKANGYGLYDMSGNVWEWCEDEWHSNYKGAPNDGSAWIALKLDNAKNKKVLRGGSWCDYVDVCRVSYRNYLNPVISDSYSGFRVVR